MRYGVRCGSPHCVRCSGVWERPFIPTDDPFVWRRDPNFKEPKTGPWWWPFPLFRAA